MLVAAASNAAPYRGIEAGFLREVRPSDDSGNAERLPVFTAPPARLVRAVVRGFVQRDHLSARRAFEHGSAGQQDDDAGVVVKARMSLRGAKRCRRVFLDGGGETCFLESQKKNGANFVRDRSMSEKNARALFPLR